VTGVIGGVLTGLVVLLLLYWVNPMASIKRMTLLMQDSRQES